MGVEYLNVVFTNPKRVYYKGDNITVQIMLSVISTIKINKLICQVQGKATTSWEERSSSVTYTYSGEETYFDIKKIILEKKNFDLEITPGTYKYELTFQLPHNIPPTYIGKKGKIEYSITPILERPWKFDKPNKQIFVVMETLDLNQQALINPNIKEPAFLQLNETFCCCFNNGEITANIKFPCTGFTSGQKVPFTVKIENESNVRVRNLHYGLHKISIFYTYCRGYKKVKKDALLEDNLGVVVPSGTSKNISGNLHIPDIHFENLRHCRIIEINYVLWAACLFKGTKADMLIKGLSWDQFIKLRGSFGSQNRIHLANDQCTPALLPIIRQATVASMGVDGMKIVFHNKKRKFACGEPLRGYFSFVATKSGATVYKIYCQIEGNATTRWTVGSSNSATVFKGKQKYMEATVYFLQNPEGQHFEPGTYKFEFLYVLPHNIPPTYAGQKGNITYNMTAIIDSFLDRPFKFNNSITEYFIMKDNFDLNMIALIKPEIKEPKVVEFSEPFCCCCYRGNIKCVIKLPYTAFVRAQKVPINFTVVNESNVNIRGIRYCITRTETCYAQKETDNKVKKEYITSRLIAANVRARTTVEFFYNLEIPDMSFVNLHHCQIIDIGYTLEFQLVSSSPLASIMTTEVIPINFGTVPLLLANLDTVELPTPPTYEEAVNE